MELKEIARNAAVDAVAVALWNGGTIVFKTGAPGTAGTPIVTVTIGVPGTNPGFSSAASGQAVATSTAFLEATATAAGVIGQYEVFSDDPASICTGNVGLALSGADFIFTDTSFNIGDRLQITGITYTQPAS
jgi:hypothetical protein